MQGTQWLAHAVRLDIVYGAAYLAILRRPKWKAVRKHWFTAAILGNVFSLILFYGESGLAPFSQDNIVFGLIGSIVFIALLVYIVITLVKIVQITVRPMIGRSAPSDSAIKEMLSAEEKKAKP